MCVHSSNTNKSASAPNQSQKEKTERATDGHTYTEAERKIQETRERKGERDKQLTLLPLLRGELEVAALRVEPASATPRTVRALHHETLVRAVAHAVDGAPHHPPGHGTHRRIPLVAAAAAASAPAVARLWRRWLSHGRAGLFVVGLNTGVGGVVVVG